jgi:hypothetical protein
MSQSKKLRIAIAIGLCVLAIVFYVPAKALMVSLGLPPTLVLLIIAIVALVLVARN